MFLQLKDRAETSKKLWFHEKKIITRTYQQDIGDAASRMRMKDDET